MDGYVSGLIKSVTDGKILEKKIEELAIGKVVKVSLEQTVKNQFYILNFICFIYRERFNSFSFMNKKDANVDVCLKYSYKR